MHMCKLLEYRNYFSMTLGIVWNYYWDEVDDDANENNSSRTEQTTAGQ